ncbi:MAG: 50S ribosomal protein L22 [uncultured DHVE6 group euryarchaeote]|jgi:large subunit ribosomal protein L22|nr:MAG: 50S ribosomal protein L22 [uncultured DHVE6 group euryarchaeote]
MVRGISMQTYDGKTMAKVIGTNLPVSKKIAYEVTNHIRGRTIDKAIALLQDVQKLKTPVPYKRYNKDTPHRKGDFASGRFPEKAARYIIPMLESLKANAENKGLTGELIIVHAAAHMTGKRHRYGRIQGLKRTTHVELVAAPKVEKKKPAKKVEPKKVEPKKVEPKKENPTPKKAEEKSKSESKPKETKK